MRKKTLIISIALGALIALGLSLKEKNNLPVVAIANWGAHASLEAAITGLKQELADQGFVENKTICYEIADVGFDASLIPQMITKLSSQAPKVLVVMSTPVAQFAKGAVQKIPLIYSVITDPVESGLIPKENTPGHNISGSSERQDLTLLLEFSKKILPQAKRVGLLYSTGESNDQALVKMMQEAGHKAGMEVVAIGVDHAREVAMRMQGFKDRVDFLYVGTSGAIQPTLPVIAAEASKMQIPVLNAEEAAVKDGLAMASFGVNYTQVGRNAGKLVAKVLGGTPMNQIRPLYPQEADHHGFLNKKKADLLGIKIPATLSNVTVME